MTVQIEFIVADDMDTDQLDCFVEDPYMMEELHRNGLVKPIKVLDGKVFEKAYLKDGAYFNDHYDYEIVQ